MGEGAVERGWCSLFFGAEGRGLKVAGFGCFIVSHVGN
jgi:hypothetical protein